MAPSTMRWTFLVVCFCGLLSQCDGVAPVKTSQLSLRGVARTGQANASQLGPIYQLLVTDYESIDDPGMKAMDDVDNAVGDVTKNPKDVLADSIKEVDVVGDLTDPIDKIKDIAHKIDNPLEPLEKPTEQAIEKTKKTVMSRINAMRTELCWRRHDLAHHEPCLKFLGIHCAKEDDGAGICDKFRDFSAKGCKTEDEDDPAHGEFKDLMCENAIKLGADMSEKEEPAKEEEKPVKEGEKPEVAAEAEDEGKLAAGGSEEAGATVADMDGDGVPDSEDPDIDGDGVDNEEDAFPRDASEHKDTDGDGIGDNKDPDIDGDGLDNADDAFPEDPNEWSDMDGDGIGDNSDDDIDGDGQKNEEDAFPKDPKEWLDSDGDGIGDNADKHPNDPNCWDDDHCDEPQAQVPEDYKHQVIDKEEKPLPEQGYHRVGNEEAGGSKVEHNDEETYTGDWQKERPHGPEVSHESEQESINRICEENPESDWCKRFRKLYG